MMFNITADTCENKIIGVSQAFEVNQEFFNNREKDKEKYGENNIDYYAMVDVDFNLLQEFSDDFRKIQREVELNQILYPNEFESQEWIIDHEYSINDTIIHNGFLYRVVQAHRSQTDWTPDKTPALYVLMGKADSAGKIKEWIQPTGAHNAYNMGDKVLFNGKTYESLINANTWSPTAYPAGWKLV